MTAKKEQGDNRNTASFYFHFPNRQLCTVQDVYHRSLHKSLLEVSASIDNAVKVKVKEVKKQFQLSSSTCTRTRALQPFTVREKKNKLARETMRRQVARTIG